MSHLASSHQQVDSHIPFPLTFVIHCVVHFLRSWHGHRFRTRSEPESKPDSGFESRNQNLRFPVSGFRFRLGVPSCRSLPWRLSISGFSSFFLFFLHFSTFSTFSTFFNIFPHFPHFFPFWSAPGGLLGALSVACCAGSHPVVLALALSFHPLSGPACSRSCVGTCAHGEHQMTAERSHLGTAQQW